MKEPTCVVGEVVALKCGGPPLVVIEVKQKEPIAVKTKDQTLEPKKIPIPPVLRCAGWNAQYEIRFYDLPANTLWNFESTDESAAKAQAPSVIITPGTGSVQ